MVKSWYCSKIDVAYAVDESYPEYHWCIPQDVGWKSYYRISQWPRSPSSVSELLQPSVALANTVGTSYRKTKKRPTVEPMSVLQRKMLHQDWSKISRQMEWVYECRALDRGKKNYSKKLFCRYISFFFFQILKVFDRLGDWEVGVALSRQGLVTKLNTASKG